MAGTEETFIPVSRRLRLAIGRVRNISIGFLIGSILQPWLYDIVKEKRWLGGDQPWDTLTQNLDKAIHQPSNCIIGGVAIGCWAAAVAFRWAIDHDWFHSTNLRRPAETLPELRARFEGTPVTGFPLTRWPKLFFAEGSITRESMHSLRTILRRKPKSACRTVLISSSDATEGKSTIALGLAWSFASSGDRVTLVDADLRASGLTRLMEGIDDHIINALEAGYQVKERVAGSLLRVIGAPIDPRVADPATVLERMNRESAWVKLQVDCDWLIIDGPPVLGFADAPILSEIADDVVYAIEAGSTKLETVVNSISRLASSDSMVLVLTKTTEKWREVSLGFDPASFGYGYGYGYYYGRPSDNKQIPLIPWNQFNAAAVRARLIGDDTIVMAAIRRRFLIAPLVVTSILLGLYTHLMRSSFIFSVGVTVSALIIFAVVPIAIATSAFAMESWRASTEDGSPPSGDTE